MPTWLRRLFLFIFGFLFVSALVGGYFWFTPRLLSVSPQPGTGAAPSEEPLRLVFSRPMRPTSVTERLAIDPPLAGTVTWEGNTLVFTPLGGWPAGIKFNVRLASGARAAGWLALALTQETNFSFTVGYPRLLYLYPADGAANLYALNPYTGESQQLTNSPVGLADFHADLKGRSAFFSVLYPQGGSTIYRLDLQALLQGASAEPQPVLECPQAQCRLPQASPRGDFLAYERTVLNGGSQPLPSQVWLFPLQEQAAGATPTPPRPSRAGDSAHQTLQPLWSPDGALTFYDADQQAFIVLDPYSGKTTSFANQTGQGGSWDPSGQVFVAPEIISLDPNISTTAGLDMLTQSHLQRFARQGGRPLDLTRDDNLEDSAPSFSPDGKLLAFARRFLDNARWTPGRQLWVMRPDGGQARPLTNDPNYTYNDFAWGPQSDQLAYVRFNQTALHEPPELWLASVAGGQARQLAVGGFAPQWVP